jgi:hypothetical protein
MGRKIVRVQVSYGLEVEAERIIFLTAADPIELTNKLFGQMPPQFRDILWAAVKSKIDVTRLWNRLLPPVAPPEYWPTLAAATAIRIWLFELARWLHQLPEPTTASFTTDAKRGRGLVISTQSRQPYEVWLNVWTKDIFHREPEPVRELLSSLVMAFYDSLTSSPETYWPDFYDETPPVAPDVQQDMVGRLASITYVNDDVQVSAATKSLTGPQEP